MVDCHKQALWLVNVSFCDQAGMTFACDAWSVNNINTYMLFIKHRACIQFSPTYFYMHDLTATSVRRLKRLIMTRIEWTQMYSSHFVPRMCGQILTLTYFVIRSVPLLLRNINAYCTKCTFSTVASHCTVSIFKPVGMYRLVRPGNGPFGINYQKLFCSICNLCHLLLE